ncbi:MAG: T9SS type B sorting domain-containing protein [Bacteroidota bacterium]
MLLFCKRHLLLLALFLVPYFLISQVVLTHNVGEFADPQPLYRFCSNDKTGRVFVLEDFGVPENEELILSSAEIAYRSSAALQIGYNIYAIDADFPASFANARLLGSSQLIELPTTPQPFLEHFNVIRANFDTPIVVPVGVKRIFVEVYHVLQDFDTVFVRMYTVDETDVSWYYTGSCSNGNVYFHTWTSRDNNGQPDYHFYLKVFEAPKPTPDYEINYVSPCSDLAVRFELTNTDTIASVDWDFGDADAVSGTTASELTPTHVFSSEGTYTVTAVIMSSSGEAIRIQTNITVQDRISVYPVADLYACETISGTGNSPNFDTSHVESTVLGGQSELVVAYFDGAGNPLPSPLPNPLSNLEVVGNTVTVRLTDPKNPECFKETTFALIVTSLPLAFTPEALFACDNDGDGISEYFDTSGITQQVLGNQIGLQVSYFDGTMNPLPSPLPNPLTNTLPYHEYITIRVANLNGTCFAETQLELQTLPAIQISTPSHLFACDEGNGYGYFNTALVESELIGERKDLTVTFTDGNGNLLPIPLPEVLTNTTPYKETITVRVTHPKHPDCFEETRFDLIVNDPLQIDLLDSYILCDPESPLILSVNPNWYSWEWFFEDGQQLSNTYQAELSQEGSYTLFVSSLENNVLCESMFSFEILVAPPIRIEKVNSGDCVTEGFIEILSAGAIEPEYSIDGVHYQDSNVFPSVPGGLYQVYARDKTGCSLDVKNIFVLDYPRFFTPNGDGVNDYWKVPGLEGFPKALVHIYDRYGKLIKQMGANDSAWDGTYRGKQMPSSDYWFSLDLQNGRNCKKHFALKR